MLIVNIEYGTKWPIVTCFQDWQFPPTLPSHWERVPKPTRPATTTAPSTFSSAVLARDICCRISGHYTGAEVAHICPRNEADWFFANGLSRWNNDTSLGEQSLLDDHANLMLLRSDLHKAFDDGKFVLYPKDNTGFFVHMMEPSPDLGILYHNARTHSIVNCRAEFIYARFAWSLFRFLSGFLAMPVDRAVITVQNGPEQSRVVELRKWTEIRERMTSSRGRSPRKRKQPAADDGGAEEEGEHKRRRCSTESAMTRDKSTPALETDVGTQLQVLGCAEDGTVEESAERRKIRELRDEHLQAQRPVGFVPPVSPFEDGTTDAKEVLERLGFEIIEDDLENG